MGLLISGITLSDRDGQGERPPSRAAVRRCGHCVSWSADMGDLAHQWQPLATACAPAAECGRSGRKGLLEPYRDQLLDQRHRKGLIDTEAQGP